MNQLGLENRDGAQPAAAKQITLTARYSCFHRATRLPKNLELPSVGVRLTKTRKCRHFFKGHGLDG